MTNNSRAERKRPVPQRYRAQFLVTGVYVLIQAIAGTAAFAQTEGDTRKQPLYEMQRLELPRLTPLIQGAKNRQGQSGSGDGTAFSAERGAAGSAGIRHAANAFLYLEGIAGPATHRDYVGWIRLTGMREEVVSGTGAGAPAARPLTIMKPVDSASVPLRRAAVSGQNLPQAALVFVGGGEVQPELYRLVLNNVRIARVETILREESVVEEVVLTYERVTWRFNLRFATGEAAGALSGCWDYRSNSGC